MKLLMLMPPGMNDKWVSREYKDGYFDIPHPPYLALSVAGLLLSNLDIEIEFLDAQLKVLGTQDTLRYINEGNFDAAIVFLGIISIAHDSLFTDLPIPTLAIMPARLDKKFAIARYHLKADAYTDSEVEWTALSFVKACAEGRGFEQIPGLYTVGDEGIKHTGSFAPPDFSSLPLPAFHLADISGYLDLQERTYRTRYVYLGTSRGCPFNCYYCASPDPEFRKVNAKTAPQVLQEIRLLYEHFGVDSFYFIEDEFASDMQRAKYICRLIIDWGSPIRFIIMNHVLLVDEELIHLLKKAGCVLIRLGIETADPIVQQETNKVISTSDAISAFNLCRKHDLPTEAFFMLGFPGESEVTIDINLKLISKIHPDRVTIGILFPKPYSRMYFDYKDKGLLLTDNWSELYPDRLYFLHEYWKDKDQIWKSVRRFQRLADRNIIGYNIRHGQLSFSNFIRYLLTLPLFSSLRRKNNAFTRLIRRFYHGYTKMQVSTKS